MSGKQEVRILEEIRPMDSEIQSKMFIVLQVNWS